MEISSKTRTYCWDFSIAMLWLPFIHFSLQLCTSAADRKRPPYAFRYYWSTRHSIRAVGVPGFDSYRSCST
ncbi:hypothetical protein EDD18DRAFT_1127942 [Armillaria luteobubalina]|uniref:Uncharacterized protein n=1 Tax=Armillaria luteobubalina TaxID=153913 RepID=A0AA39QLJ6_9AGAR|nr:hypothetical protein EDD18DRAFT_1127942 [Armillaria luteobubalina]